MNPYHIHISLPIYPGTCLLAPLGSTKFKVITLSITDGVVLASPAVVETAVDIPLLLLLTTGILCVRIRLDELTARRNMMLFENGLVDE